MTLLLQPKNAFTAFSQSTVTERLDLLEAITAKLKERNDEIAAAISLEMDAPLSLAREKQAPSGASHFDEVIRVLRHFKFEEPLGSTLVRREPIGVCALITPWNWPINQVAVKVAPAIASGCSMVLKPGELTPLNAQFFAEILHEAGTPAGVFSMIHGDGIGVGQHLTTHPDVDMISFTGSTFAGETIIKNTAPDIKRVALELGGKSAGIILDDADFATAIPASVYATMENSGQSCNASTRLLVPENRYDEVVRIISDTVKNIRVGGPSSKTYMGPVANRRQYRAVLSTIKTDISEGAELIAGGDERPDDLTKGFFVKPTVFGRVRPDMRIAQEEIFGPVLSVLTYAAVEEAIEIANDSKYGLSGSVWSLASARAYDVAKNL